MTGVIGEFEPAALKLESIQLRNCSLNIKTFNVIKLTYLYLLRTFSVLLLLYLYSLFFAYTNIWVPENECTSVRVDVLIT